MRSEPTLLGEGAALAQLIVRTKYSRTANELFNMTQNWSKMISPCCNVFIGFREGRIIHPMSLEKL